MQHNLSKDQSAKQKTLSNSKLARQKPAKDDEDDNLDRDFTEYDTLENSKFIKEGSEPSIEIENTSNQKPYTSGDLLGRSPQKEHRTFKISSKGTLPRPSEISKDDKIFLLPKLAEQNGKLRN